MSTFLVEYILWSTHKGKEKVKRSGYSTNSLGKHHAREAQRTSGPADRPGQGQVPVWKKQVCFFHFVQVMQKNTAMTSTA
jgi:hypothetical protein